MAADIRVGTSGWNYPSGAGTWNGVFYPARRTRGFDELRFYAEHFDTVEVNSSFYRVPDPDTAKRWVERTPPNFTFSIKLYQKFTHPEMYVTRTGVTDWDVTPGDLDEFRRGIEPVANAGRLVALLLQFPTSFHAETETRDYLAWLLSAFADYPLAVELRHRTWSDAADETTHLLAQHRAGLVTIDEPKFRDSIDSRIVASEEPIVYFRFHGRNFAAWWEHAESADRYNYLYAREELAPFAQAARAAASQGRRVVMYMNNHFSAKSAANAAILKHELGQQVPGEYPREMVNRYPELNGIVATSGLPL